MISRRRFWGALFGASIAPKPDGDKKTAFIRIKPGGRLENVEITIPPGYDAGAIFEGDMTCTGNLTIQTIKEGEFTNKTRLDFPSSKTKRKKNK